MTLKFSKASWTGAVLAWHTAQAILRSRDFILTLDNEYDGDLEMMAAITLDDALSGDEYDPLLDLFGDLDDEQMEQIGVWGKSMEMTRELTNSYKALESTARRFSSQTQG